MDLMAIARAATRTRKRLATSLRVENFKHFIFDFCEQKITSSKYLFSHCLRICKMCYIGCLLILGKF